MASRFSRFARSLAVAALLVPAVAGTASAQEAGVCVTVYEIDLVIVSYEVKICDSTGGGDDGSSDGVGGGGGGGF